MPRFSKRVLARMKKIEQGKKAWRRMLHEELRALPKRYGFPSVRSFVVAVNEAGRGTPSGRKRRVEVTPKLRAEARRRYRSGWTAERVAEHLNLSLSAVFRLCKGIIHRPARKHRR